MEQSIVKIFEHAATIRKFSKGLIEGYGYNITEIKDDNGGYLFPLNKTELINAMKSTKIKTEIVRLVNCCFVLEIAVNCAAKINGNDNYHEVLKTSNIFKDESTTTYIAMIRMLGNNALAKMIQCGRYADFESEELRKVAASIDINLFVLTSLIDVSRIGVKPFIDSLLNEYNHACKIRPKVAEDNYFYNNLKEIGDKEIDLKEFFAILGRAELAIRHIGSLFLQE